MILRGRTSWTGWIGIKDQCSEVESSFASTSATSTSSMISGMSSWADSLLGDTLHRGGWGCLGGDSAHSKDGSLVFISISPFLGFDPKPKN